MKTYKNNIFNQRVRFSFLAVLLSPGVRRNVVISNNIKLLNSETKIVQKDFKIMVQEIAYLDYTIVHSKDSTFLLLFWCQVHFP